MKLILSNLCEFHTNFYRNNLNKILKYEYFDLGILTALYVSTIFINKYVLSVLKFTFPTVFQGWQTLIGMIILKILNVKRVVEVSAIDVNSALNLLPHCIFFLGSIVSGSKALAVLPIPVFISISNLPQVCIYLLDYCASMLATNLIQVTAGVVSLGAAVSIIILDVRLPFADSGYSWLLAHVVFTTAQMLYSRISNPRFTETDKLYYSNIFSVVILAPSSFYLEEAFSALNFQHRRQLRFYAGCLLSGILGVSFQLWSSKLRLHRAFTNSSAVAKIAACTLAIPIFMPDMTFTLWTFVALNLAATAVLPSESEPSSITYQETLEV